MVSALDAASDDDASSSHDASPGDGALAAPDTSNDASSDAQEASIHCTDGDYFVQVTDDEGVHTLSSGCGEAGAPTASMGGCGDKLICLFVVACGGGSIQLTSEFGSSPGSHGVVASYERADASAPLASYSGTIVVADWPDAGGTVGGEYSVQSQDAGSLTGAFCVLRR